MRTCLKCGDFYADQQLVFCLTDGTPLVGIDPDSDIWNKAERAVEDKQNALRKLNRKLRWQRVMLRAMLMATLVVAVAAVKRSIFVTVEPPRGELRLATFNDRNGDGAQNQGEPGFAGLIFQVRGTDPANPLTVELEAGASLILPVGTYTVTPPDGWIATTPTTVTVTTDQPTDVLVGSKEETSKLCIEMFDDLNGNGVKDEGEAGLSGFAFQVSGAVAATTLTTGLNGGGCAVLPVGTYTLVEQPREGWIATTPATQTIIVSAGQAANVLFGSRQQGGKLCIRTFDDSNSNHSQDEGEANLAGFVFQVQGTAHSVMLTTDSDGGCSDLPAGIYNVTQQPLGGWVATTPTTQKVIVAAGQSANVSFGIRRETGKLCIATFNDRNGDGVRDAGEPFLPGFVFEVRGTGDAKPLTTDFRGSICAVLPVGAYTLIRQPQSGWIATTPTTPTLIVTANQTVNASFGSRRETANLCIEMFDDVNGNGSQDEGEAALSGFVFEVSGTEAVKTLTTRPNGICSPLPLDTYTVIEQPRQGWIATTATKRTVTVSSGQGASVSFGGRRETGKLCISTFEDSNGNRAQDKGEPAISGFTLEVSGPEFSKTFTPDSERPICLEVPAGKYTVVAHPQSNWIATTPTTAMTNVTAGQTANVSFGSRRGTGKLCIKKFDDLNGNGEPDKGEPTLSGFAFEVNGPESSTFTPDSERTCLPLPAGKYSLTERPRSGWIATTPTKRMITITPGEATNLSFGSRQEAGKLCIRKFEDLNGNGTQDPGEQGLPGFVFQVSGTDFVRALPTDLNGNACLSLPPGRYMVAETPKHGWTATTPMKQPVTLTTKGETLFFGNAKSEPECSDIDKSREAKVIITRYLDLWRKSVESEQERVIAEVAPRANGKVRATLEEFRPLADLPTCTRAFIAIRYVWLIEVLGGGERARTERVRGERIYQCQQMGGNWICRRAR